MGEPTKKGLDGDFSWFCSAHYIQTPFTFWSIWNLFKKGYYLESLILIRHILEAFIRMRYFNKYPEKLETHLINNKIRISYKKMFDEFSLGFYKYYSDQLSEATHGVFLKDIFRINREDKTNPFVITNTNFNLMGADIVIFWMILLLYAYMRWFLIFFPNSTMPEEIKIRSSEKQDTLQSIMNKHKKVNQHTNEIYMKIEKIIMSING